MINKYGDLIEKNGLQQLSFRCVRSEAKHKQ